MRPAELEAVVPLRLVRARVGSPWLWFDRAAVVSPLWLAVIVEPFRPKVSPFESLKTIRDRLPEVVPADTSTGAAAAVPTLNEMVLPFVLIVRLPTADRLEVFGTLLFTASADKTVRVWDTESRRCIKVLEGHSFTEYVFPCQHALVAWAKQWHGRNKHK